MQIATLATLLRLFGLKQIQNNTMKPCETTCENTFQGKKLILLTNLIAKLYHNVSFFMAIYKPNRS